MADYKIIYRADNPGWQEGCPIEIAAIQVPRDTASGQAYLQIKLRNISNDKVSAVAINGTVSSPVGDKQDFEFVSLDADIEPGAFYTPDAQSLEVSEIEEISVSVTRVDESTDWPAFEKLPEQEKVELSPRAQEEKTAQLTEAGLRTEMPFRLVDEGNWWRCACGQINVGRDTCCTCYAPKDILPGLEDDEALCKQAVERAYDKAKKQLEGKDLPAVERAKTTFQELGDYKDSSELVAACDKRIAELKSAKSRRNKIIVAAGVVAAIALGGTYYAVSVAIPQQKTDEAIELAQNGDYDAALNLLVENNLASKKPEIDRIHAEKLTEAGEYQQAIDIYTEINDEEAVQNVYSAWGDATMKEENYARAFAMYYHAKNAESKAACIKAMIKAKKYELALEALTQYCEADEFEGYDDLYTQSAYGYVKGNYNDTDENTYKYLKELSEKGYKDSKELYDKLYQPKITGSINNRALYKYNNIYFDYTVSGYPPGADGDHELVITNSINNKEKGASTSNGTHSVLLARSRIDSGVNSVTVTITDKKTGETMLNETYSF